MKKNGFTFIEILGVITLLALISTIILLSVSKSLKDSKEKLYQVEIENIKSAASMWRTDHIELIPEDDYYIISLKDLQNEGYIKEDIINPKTDELINKTTLIGIGMNNINVGDAVDTNDIVQRIDNYINQEIQAINNKLSTSTQDGIYYYNNVGNLENGASIIYPTREWNRPRGNILIHNHQFISGCIQINGINYDIYKTTVTKLDYPCSTTRGENLIVNGDLSFGDNTNFSDFTYNSDGYLSRTTSAATVYFNNLFIPVDTEKKYEYGVTVKTNNTQARVYMGFYPQDIDHNPIQTYHYSYIANTLTTLARDLNNGDNYIYLTDMANWNTTTTASHNHGFIFWNYVDSTGYHYPELTYSRNAWKDLYDNTTTEIINDVEVVTNNIEKNVEIDGQIVNRIKLKSAWNKGNVPAGTKLSQSSDGSTYPYTLLSGSNLSLDWTRYTAIIQGIGGNGMHDKFKNGQRYLKFMVIPNHGALQNVTTYYKDFYLREIIE